MKLKIPGLFSQRDSRWAGTLLGYNTSNPYTIGNYGCLITCLGMMIDKTPLEVNQILKDVGGFTTGSGELIWSKTKALGLNTEYLSARYESAVTSQGIAKAKSVLDSGKVLLCEIDFNPATVGEEMHFVVCVGYDGDNFIINDPWTGTQKSFDTYGGFSRAILQFRVLDKTYPQDGDQTNTVDVDSKVFEELVRKSTITDKVAEKLNVDTSETIILGELDKLITYEDTVVAKDKQLQEASIQISALEAKITDLSTNNTSLLSENINLSDKIKEQSVIITQQGSSIEDLKKDIEDIKDQVKRPVFRGWKKTLVDFLAKL